MSSSELIDSKIAAADAIAAGDLENGVGNMICISKL
jgi:hypothetical protein